MHHDRVTELRKILADKYIFGTGVEIGALHRPVETKQKVSYVDRISKEELRIHYPELKDLELFVDVVDDGEKLDKFFDGSLDFIIANHFIEHCKDPIGTIETHLRKLKEGGVLFYAVPDKDFTFDNDREATTFEHLLSDYKEPNSERDYQHYIEWAKYVNSLEGEQIETRAKELWDEGYSVHCHCWSFFTFMDFLQNICPMFDITVEAIVKSEIEFIVILRK